MPESNAQVPNNASQSAQAPKQLFVIDITYTAELPVIEANLQNHRAYLAKGYEAGFLLASGPKNPRVGGVIIGRFDDLAQAKAFAANDPFAIKNIATHTITEFSPVLHASDIAGFVRK
ncbi:hypothetical protein BKN38_09085 [Helicobacter sp. CLO-3]|uniref:YciI family protein n=1 Tax=unclassified Helicobacter TaxID=2593540 RepID=UPI0008057F7D|nr:MULTISPECIES: YciI family protein [unclassified Helicobacter]OBV28898.1 hypothetical protein BA723_07610 [Helicobacter sp. CLO-3]OHU81419.1 hypothetical protein BKN38_09085 [Helicobacter sp. CLO-3]